MTRLPEARPSLALLGAALLKTVGTASALRLLRGLSRPRLDAIAVSGSKQSSVK